MLAAAAEGAVAEEAAAFLLDGLVRAHGLRGLAAELLHGRGGAAGWLDAGH